MTLDVQITDTGFRQFDSWPEPVARLLADAKNDLPAGFEDDVKQHGYLWFSVELTGGYTYQLFMLASKGCHLSIVLDMRSRQVLMCAWSCKDPLGKVDVYDGQNAFHVLYNFDRFYLSSAEKSDVYEYFVERLFASWRQNEVRKSKISHRVNKNACTVKEALSN